MLCTRQAPNLLAVDLGIDAIHVLSARTSRGKVQVEDLACETLPAGLPATLPDRHLEALGGILSKLRLRSRRVVAALPTNLILTRTIRLDPGQEQTTEERIIWTLQNCLPFDPRDLVFDYWPVGEDHGKGQEVIVVATQASLVERYLNGFEKLKLQCVHLDVVPCALGALIARTVQPADSPVCTLALTAGQGFFGVAERGKILFWRPFELAGTGSQTELGQKHLERIAEEVARCFTHIAGSMPLEKLSQMMLFGQWSDNPALGNYLGNHFHLPTRNPSPLQALGTDGLSAAAQQTATQAQSTHYAAVVGLTLQYSGGVHHG
ncbi:MAG: pilus assembly protein PilM [Phycisphaerae bacterium]